MIGTPRNEVIGGWFGGKPKESGWAAMFGIRNEWPSRMIRPSKPWPRGGAPILARCSGVTPTVMNRSIRPPASTMPSAAYWAWARSRTLSTIS